MTSKIDTNVANYTLSELMAIIDIQDLDKNEITEKTNTYINRFKNKDPNLSVFFMEIQSQLLQYSSNLSDPKNPTAPNIEGFTSMVTKNEDNPDEEDEKEDEEAPLAEYPAGEEQQQNWYENEALPQDDSNQTDKQTQRKQKIDVFNNDQVPMNREQLGVSNNFQVPVAQDSLNPNLKNTITRFVNLDSQFRQYSSSFESSSTDYTLDLSDPITNALSIRLFSYQIPYSWYIFDNFYGNTCFWISDGSYNIPVTIAPGNYVASDFVTNLNASFTKSGFSFPPPVSPITTAPASYNTNNGKITLNLIDGSCNTIFDGNPITFTITTATVIIFYDHTAQLQCKTVCVNKNFYLNQSLGWYMGYRVPYINVDPSGNVASSVIDLTGTKYLILAIDDYNQNHVNNGFVSIAEYSNVLKMPSYYSPDLPYTCSRINTNPSLQNTNDMLLSGKQNSSYVQSVIVQPSAPRTLTTSQIYTINEISKNKSNNTNYRTKAPTSTDVLAVIPIKTPGSYTGSLLVEISGSLQENIRNYFGPVNIDRMHVKLLDDKGNQLNLNGLDWCVTLICECLYQY